MESQAQRRGRSSRRRATTRGPLQKSEDTTPGRESWRSARGREMVLLTTPQTRGLGKRRVDRGGGAAKRPCHRTAGTSRKCPGAAVPRTDRGEVACRLPDP